MFWAGFSCSLPLNKDPTIYKVSQYEFIYFNVRGRGHHIRYLLVDQGIEFKDTRVTGDQWKDLKPKMAFGQIPCLKDGDFQLVQSNAILRYLGRKHGLYGDTIQEAALIDMVNDSVEDVRVKYAIMIYRNYEEGKQPYIETLPGMMENFERLLAANNGGKGFIVGMKISYADYNLADLLDSQLVLLPTVLDGFPLLKGYYGRIMEREKIKAFRQTDAHKININGNGKQ